MNNEVVFAAAGNGKTHGICESALSFAIENPTENILIISYTNEGINSIESIFRRLNSGLIEPNVTIKSWYSFLLSDFLKPYQTELSLKRNRNGAAIRLPEDFIRSIDFYSDERKERYYSKEQFDFFFHRNGDLWKDDVSDLAVKCNQDSDGKPIKRLENIYSKIFIDELQDYAGWDLEIIKLLFQSKIEVKCVGDYKQATFETNNSQKNKQYRNFAIKVFFQKLKKENLCSIQYSNLTNRCCSEVCEYVNTIYPEETSSMIVCNKSKAISMQYSGVYVVSEAAFNLILHNTALKFAVLRYNKNASVGVDCPKVFNYGASKGQTYENVAIYPNGTVLPFIKNGTGIVSPRTKAKFYVACTRTKYSLFFIIDDFCENDLFKRIRLKIDGFSVDCFSFLGNNNPTSSKEKP